MRTLVAGGAGFIGSHLVDRLLAEGHEVDVVDDLSSGSLSNLAEARAARTGRLKIHQVDVRDPGLGDLIEQRRPEVVYGLVSGAGSVDTVDDAERVVIGGLRLLDGARRADARKVVVAAGAEIYGHPRPSSLPVKESEFDDAHGTAAAASMALLSYLRAHREAHDVEFAMLVVASVYGPRCGQGLIAELIAGCQGQDPCEIDDDVDRTHDLVFVDDVVDAFVRAADRGSGLVVNVASGVETSGGEALAVVAASVIHAGGRGADVRFTGASSGPTRMALDSGRARIQLGWTTWTGLAEGVSQTLALG